MKQEEADALYSAILHTHEGLSPEQSHALNARLIFLFANEIGNPARVTELLAQARAAQ